MKWKTDEIQRKVHKNELCVWVIFSSHIFLPLHLEQRSYSRNNTSMEALDTEQAGNRAYQSICLCSKSSWVRMTKYLFQCQHDPVIRYVQSSAADPNHPLPPGAGCTGAGHSGSSTLQSHAPPALLGDAPLHTKGPHSRVSHVVRGGGDAACLCRYPPGAGRL